MDGHVDNYPVVGKTGCPVIISKYSESEKIKDRVKVTVFFYFQGHMRSFELSYEST